MKAAGAAYRGLSTLAGPLVEIVSAWGTREASELHRERWAREPVSPVRTWWHAASLGEVAALDPVLIRAEREGLAGAFCVTTTSATGRAAARKRWGERAGLAPLDFPKVVIRALEARNPRALILVETELWPNWLREALRRGVRIGIVNGRVSDRSWPRYRRWAPVFREVLSRVGAAAVRTETDALRFEELGIPPGNLRVCGNTKHDAGGETLPVSLPWPDTDRVWVAGSVRPGEIETVVEAWQSLLSTFPDLRLVLVPRHETGVRAAMEATGRAGCRVQRRSDSRPPDGLPQVLVVDTRGELPGFYARADVAFVGGTLVPVGGHNPVEPAREGTPVILGPHLENVAEEARRLQEHGGATTIRGKGDLAAAVRGLLWDPGALSLAIRGARAGAEALVGASGRSVDWLRERGVLAVNDD